jgi:hypothetical protein
VIIATFPGSADLAAALVLYDSENQKDYDLLALAMANCPEGRTVMTEFEMFKRRYRRRFQPRQVCGRCA